MSVINTNGTIVLFFSGLISKVFGAIYRIPLSNLLGAEGMGLYQMAFPIYSFLLTIITGGISVILTRKIASSRARGDFDRISKDFKIAKNICWLLGAIFLLFLIIFAYPMSIFQGNSNAFIGYIAIAFGFVFACMLGAYRGYYQGFGNMLPTAISQILEQVIKLILGLTLGSVLMKFGTTFGVFGALLGVSISEIICFCYFKLVNKKIKISKAYVTKSEYQSFFKEFLPIGFSYGVLPLSSLIDSFLIVNLLVFSGFSTTISTSLYGIETGMVLPLINMPNVLISAIAITAIPEISYKKEVGDNYVKSISLILKIVYMLILPCVIGLFILSKPIIINVYSNLNAEFVSLASTLLKLSAFEMFFLSFVSITNSVLQAIGKTVFPLYSLIIGMAIKFILVLILVSNNAINIYGLVIASIFGYVITASVNLYKIKKICGARLNLSETCSPLISSCAMLGIILILITKLNVDLSFFSLILIVGISAIIYFTFLYVLGEFKIKEVKNMLQKMVK